MTGSLRCTLILREFNQIFIACLFKGSQEQSFFPSNTPIYSISRDGPKKLNIRTCEHMVLGQLRMGARQAKNAPLIYNPTIEPARSLYDGVCHVLVQTTTSHETLAEPTSTCIQISKWGGEPDYLWLSVWQALYCRHVITHHCIFDLCTETNTACLLSIVWWFYTHST